MAARTDRPPATVVAQSFEQCCNLLGGRQGVHAIPGPSQVGTPGSPQALLMCISTSCHRESAACISCCVGVVRAANWAIGVCPLRASIRRSVRSAPLGALIQINRRSHFSRWVRMTRCVGR